MRVVEWVLEGYTNDTLSDEPQHTYSAREIVLELFPATPERLVPNIDDYRLESDPDGNVIVLNAVPSFVTHQLVTGEFNKLGVHLEWKSSICSEVTLSGFKMNVIDID